MNEPTTRKEFILAEFWAFLKGPAYYSDIPVFSLLTASKLFVSFCVIRFLGIVLEINGFHPLVHYFTGQELQKQVHPNLGLGHLLVGSLVSAPLFEELAYRWGLRFNPIRTAVSVGLIVFYWLPYGGTYSMSSIRGVVQEPGFYLMVGLGLVAGFTAYVLFVNPLLGGNIQEKWEQNFGWIFYISSLLFGFMHIFNVSGLSLAVVSLVPLITFQQILFGFFNGYVRMRYGFIQAIVQHALFNAVPVLIQITSYP